MLRLHAVAVAAKGLGAGAALADPPGSLFVLKISTAKIIQGDNQTIHTITGGIATVNG
jgi:hypothetical protein